MKNSIKPIMLIVGIIFMVTGSHVLGDFFGSKTNAPNPTTWKVFNFTPKSSLQVTVNESPSMSIEPNRFQTFKIKPGITKDSVKVNGATIRWDDKNSKYKPASATSFTGVPKRERDGNIVIKQDSQGNLYFLVNNSD